MLTTTKFCSLIFAAISISVFLLTAVIDPSTLSVTTSTAPVHNISEDLPPSDTITMNLGFNVPVLTEVIESTINHHDRLHENQYYHKPSLAVKDLFETASVAFQTLLAVDLFHEKLSTNTKTKSANRGDLILCGSIEFELLGLGCIHQHHAAHHHHHSSSAPPTLAMANLEAPRRRVEENFQTEEIIMEESEASSTTAANKFFESMEELGSIQNHDSTIMQTTLTTFQSFLSVASCTLFACAEAWVSSILTGLYKLCKFFQTAYRIGMVARKSFRFFRKLYRIYKAYNYLEKLYKTYSLFACSVALVSSILTGLYKLCKFFQMAYRIGMFARKVFRFIRKLYGVYKAYIYLDKLYKKYQQQPKVKEFLAAAPGQMMKKSSPLLPL